MSDSSPEQQGAAEEPDSGLELLARAVEFLSVCRRDPDRAMETDDPALLVEGLRSLLADLGSRRARARVADDEAGEADPPLAA